MASTWEFSRHAQMRWAQRVRQDPEDLWAAWQGSRFQGQIVVYAPGHPRGFVVYGYQWERWIFVSTWHRGTPTAKARWVVDSVWPVQAWERKWRQQLRREGSEVG